MEKEHSKHKSPFLDKFVFVFFVLLLVSGICLTAAIYFQKKYFNYFFVNGQSMYPTLNLHATNAKGVEYKELGPSVEKGSTHVDYGFYDCHETIVNNIQRFDIVICKYSQQDPSDKIKRVVVLPGETFYFGLGEDNGKLYVADVNGKFQLVDQPSQIDINKGSYSDWGLNHDGTGHTLKKDEYFVVGDNRGHSSDSRVNGPIKKENIEGKVIGLIGECEIDRKDSSYYPINISYYLPRFF